MPRSFPLRLIAALITLSCLALADAASAQELMPSTVEGWSGFSPRPDSTPGVLAAPAGSGYALEIHGNGVPTVYGGWRTHIPGLRGGQHYRFRARALPLDIASPREAVTILLRWRGTFGDQVAPDYVWKYHPQTDGSLLFDRTIQAPAGTSAVDVELVLQWASNGRVRFDGLSMMPAPAPAPRTVKLAAVSYRPSGTSSGLDSVQRAVRYGEQVAATHRPDVMLFGEMLNVIGAPGTYDAKAETVPGPSTDAMASLASAFNVNVAFGMLERDGQRLYNTAVLIDREGQIVGKHRKMQLPLAEVSVGLTPGERVSVFNLDVGRVALLICQDTAFPEPAREAAIQGAELLLVPIWGGKPELVAARAIEQSMYVLASGYDYLSEVVNPLGAVLDRVESLNQADVAVTSVDLSHRFREDWSGDWRDVSNKQRRMTPSPYNAEDAPPANEPPPPPPPPNSPPAVTITTPSNGTTFTAPASISVSVAASDSDGSVARVDLFAGATLIASDAASPYQFSWTNVAAGSYTLTARAIDNAGGTTTSLGVQVNVSAPPPPPPSLPSPWQTQDIGAVGTPGTASASTGTFTVEGAGADIWGTADAFRYVWQTVSGDMDVIARVVSAEYVHDWVKAGVMIREGLTPDSAHALMLVSPGTKGLAFQRRVAAGGVSTHTTGGAGTPPMWVKLQRRGNTISAYRSADGSAWTLVGSDTFSMGSTVDVGLAVSSHNTSELATVVFDNVSVSAASAPAPVSWQQQDVGAVGVAGSAASSGDRFTISGSGADVWGAADAFHFVWQRLSGDRDIVARVSSVEYVHAWVKAGVMIRQHLGADSPHAFMIVSAGKGLAFQRRLTPGGLSTSTSGGFATAPMWVKLERRGNVISAYFSADGAAWTFVGSDTFAMSSDVYVGLAVSSHDNTRLATATFDGVAVK